MSILLFLRVTGQEHRLPEPFNLGRTRTFAGFWFSEDGKRILHTPTFKKDSASSVQVKIAESVWSNDSWSESRILHLTTGNESIPIEHSGRIYFSSSLPVDGSTTNDLNIWYSQLTEESSWGKPVILSALNSSKNDRLCFIDKTGRFYFTSDRNGNYDFFIATLLNNEWHISPLENWNSDLDEVYVSVHDELGLSLLQRTEQGIKSEIFISYKEKETWSTPAPLLYPYKSSHPFYSQRTPMISSDRSTFYFTQNGQLWFQSLSDLSSFNSQKIKSLSKMKPLKVKAPSPLEPMLFGGVTLKTNNGISFNKKLDKVYLSRYTFEKDSTGNYYIRIFESTFKNKIWSNPTLVSFVNHSAPFEYHPVLSPDEKWIYYNSRASLGGSDKYESKNNIWRWETSSKNNPIPIEQTITPFHDDYASQAKSGNLYFRSDRPGGKGFGDLYVCYFIDGKFEDPVPLDTLNSEYNENDLAIDPDEKFIIFNRYIRSSQEMQLFLSIRTATGWATPRVVSLLERKEDWELTPTISPDRKYFFYEANSNIMKVDLKSLFTKEELQLVNL